MQSDPQIIKTLNSILKFQLTSINQLFLHARIARIWGLENLNNQVYDTSIATMKAADSLIDRILFLEGLPNIQDIGKIIIGEDVPEIIECDLRLMTAFRESLTQSISICEQHADYESRSILVTNLNFVEEYIDQLESQQWLIDNTGVENFIQAQMGEE